MLANDIPNNFDSVSIKIASSTDIKNRAKRTACKMRGTEGATWPCPERGKCDCGEVKKAETINYRSLRPEPEGLFCEAIFGPQKNWECNCGKYKWIKHKGMICDRCGVEVTHSRVRRERFGYIQLAAPVAHIWFSKSYPSVLGIFCELSSRDVERVLHCEASIVMEVTDPNCPLEFLQILSELEYIEYNKKYYGKFRICTGAEAIGELLRSVDLQKEIEKLKTAWATTSNRQKKSKLTKQIEHIEKFVKSEQRPELMIMDVIPVFPAGLRMLVPLGGGKFATSDLNDLYRRILNRNNRLRKLMQFNLPEAILRNEKQQLQEVVDVLFDNQRAKRQVTDSENRTLKSLSHILTGKYGIFHQSLIGKRVNYSGRGVIVRDPELGMHQCGLPKRLAIKLFEPFIIKKLIDCGYAQTVKRAKYLTKQSDPDSPVWKVLADVIDQHPILLVSQSNSHSPGIQAFMPILIDGNAIRVPTPTYDLFNTKSNSGEVTVHVPLRRSTRFEARFRLLAKDHIRNRSNGKPLMCPSRDAVLGLNFLTRTSSEHIADAKALHKAYISQVFEPLYGKSWYRRRYTNLQEVVFAYEAGKLELHDSIQLSLSSKQVPILTTVGRVIFNQILPPDLEWIDEYTNTRIPFFNDEVTEATLTELLTQSFDTSEKYGIVSFLEKLQKLGFEYATRSGSSLTLKDCFQSISDRDGLDVIDYFSTATRFRNRNTHRIIALRKTMDLNRSLVNVASDVVITEEDCGTRRSLSKFASENSMLAAKISGRTAAENIRHPITKEILVDTGALISPQASTLINNVNIKAVKVYSVLTCETAHGICAKCYGTDLSKGTSVDFGKPIGSIAAESIRELNMQPLLMPPDFHKDIPPDFVARIRRLIELFEVPKPKKEDITSPHHILKTGSPFTKGVHIKGEEATWTYLINEIQKVYPAESLNDKHLEVIVRQMSRKIRITERGDTQFSLNEEIDKLQFHRENQKIYKNGGVRAQSEPILQGITKAALNTESFLVAASLKQPRKVLVDAAIQGKKDPLSGIKESVMTGKLIPAGTGFKTST
ncbi:MAG: hypothetical protein OXD49_06865 [Candidatus Poribacteria bacterium]|nr:hypothetical protein [Candidatus Poribacteria bacterium]